MHPQTHIKRHPARQGFTIIEMLMVIVIVSILMTLGAVGLNNLGGKGVSGSVSNAEALFEEARLTAISRNIRSCVLVARALNGSPADDLRRIVVAYEEIDPTTGEPTAGPNEEPRWEISGRGILLPDRVYYSELLSKLDHEAGTGTIDTVTLSYGKTAYQGEYFIYRFNGEGVCATPGISFVIGSGSRNIAQPATTAPPVVTASAKRDFGGFVLWRNGGSSVFRSPSQVSGNLPSVGDNF